MTDEFVEYMKNKFEMSMVGKLNYFSGLQVKQLKEGYSFLRVNMPGI